MKKRLRIAETRKLLTVKTSGKIKYFTKKTIRKITLVPDYSFAIHLAEPAKEKQFKKERILAEANRTKSTLPELKLFFSSVCQFLTILSLVQNNEEESCESKVISEVQLEQVI